MKKISYLLLLVCFTAISAHEECPSINIGDDLEEVKKDLSLKVYNAPIEDSDEDTEKAIDELRCLVESGNCYQKQISYTVALWFSAFIGHINEASAFCPLAQLINASVSKDPDQLRCALDAAGEFEKVLSIYRQQNSIVASGCCSGPSLIDNIESECCYQNGFAYQAAILWKRRGHVLPPDFCDIVHSLYSSNLIINKFLGLLISYCITSEMEILFSKYPPALSLQATSLQFSCKIPESCCESRLDILKTISGDTGDASKDILDSLKPACICPSLCVSPDDYDESLKNASLILLKKAPCSLTDAGQEVREALEQLTGSDNPRYRQIAATASILYEVYSVNLHQLPSLCAYASYLNQSLLYKSNKSKAKVHEAIEDLRKFIPYYQYLSQLVSISASGCPILDPIPKPCIEPSRPCYKDGFAYDIRRIWSSEKDVVPPGLAKKVIPLYKSRSSLDRLLALFSTYSITEANFVGFDNYDYVIGYQGLSGLVSSPIPKCCCCDRLAQLAEISERSIIVQNHVLDILKNSYCN